MGWWGDEVKNSKVYVYAALSPQRPISPTPKLVLLDELAA